MRKECRGCAEGMCGPGPAGPVTGPSVTDGVSGGKNSPSRMYSALTPRRTRGRCSTLDVAEGVRCIMRSETEMGAGLVAEPARRAGLSSLPLNRTR